jgi:CBS-domain-containing membrane protein
MDMPAWVKGRVRLPVHTRRTVETRGASSVEALVFCPLLARSVPLDLCVHCTRFREKHEDDATIACDIELPRDDGRERVDVAEAAARTFVGEVVTREPICVREDVAGELVLAMLHANRTCVPVVTPAGGLVGVVCCGALFRVQRSGQKPPAARDLARPVDQALTEDMPLSVAIGVLAACGERELPVVSTAGAVTGLLSASDVLAWMANRMGYGAK